MRFAPLAGAVLLCACAVLGLSGAASAQTAFEAKNYAECVMLYANKARTNAGTVLMRRACKCRFQNPAPADCANYSPQAVDCFLKNTISVTEENQVDGVKRACETQFPLQ